MIKTPMRIFITGGAGYVGSHAAVSLLDAGHEICIYDNFSNSSPVALDRIEQITAKKISSYKGDIRDVDALTTAFEAFQPTAVLHFAGLKAVGESVEKPVEYYDVNVGGSTALLQVMSQCGCEHIVFSSSATVYGAPEYLPYDEAHPLRPTNPYGNTKLVVEMLITDWVAANGGRSAVNLRYFNPVGAHVSGLIGEDPNGIPNNLMPFISQVASGRRETVAVFGDDYETIDGTGVRDYVHVVDLAKAHVAALGYSVANPGVRAINVGTGVGTSVLQLIQAFGQVSGQKIPWELAPRRHGDIDQFWANADLALDQLDWQASKSIEDMCQDTWTWQSKNPKGFSD
ncbi:MAG: UDP-glucose 4-epimerase [Planctomycetota bacterium]